MFLNCPTVASFLLTQIISDAMLLRYIVAWDGVAQYKRGSGVTSFQQRQLNLTFQITDAVELHNCFLLCYMKTPYLLDLGD